MKRTVAMLLLVLTGCARVYRPVALATPRPSAAGALGGSLTPQPWGDNSRYEGRAVGAHLQVLLLRVENRGSETVDLLGVEPSEDGVVWTPEEALDQVRQVGALYLLYPVAPGLLGHIAWMWWSARRAGSGG